VRKPLRKIELPEIRTYTGVEATLIEHIVKCQGRGVLCLLCDLIWLHPKGYVGRTTTPAASGDIG
jgi:hypothetical protein